MSKNTSNAQAETPGRVVERCRSPRRCMRRRGSATNKSDVRLDRRRRGARHERRPAPQLTRCMRSSGIRYLEGCSAAGTMRGDHRHARHSRDAIAPPGIASGWRCLKRRGTCSSSCRRHVDVLGRSPIDGAALHVLATDESCGRTRYNAARAYGSTFHRRRAGAVGGCGGS